MLFLTTVLSGVCGCIERERERERESWVYLLSISIMTKPKKAPHQGIVYPALSL